MFLFIWAGLFSATVWVVSTGKTSSIEIVPFFQHWSVTGEISSIIGVGNKYMTVALFLESHSFAPSMVADDSLEFGKIITNLFL